MKIKLNDDYEPVLVGDEYKVDDYGRLLYFTSSGKNIRIYEKVNNYKYSLVDKRYNLTIGKKGFRLCCYRDICDERYGEFGAEHYYQSGFCLGELEIKI